MMRANATKPAVSTILRPDDLLSIVAPLSVVEPVKAIEHSSGAIKKNAGRHVAPLTEVLIHDTGIHA
jgi:hypothetical protein